MTYNVFGGKLNPTQSVSHVSISVLTFLVGRLTEHLACTIPAVFWASGEIWSSCKKEAG